MKNKQRFFVLLFLLSVTLITFAQQKKITGRVVDTNNETLPGVSILVKGTTSGTVTNLDGNFELTVPEDNSTLIFSFIGFNFKEVNVAGLSTLNVSLEPQVIDINEVVVVGYGTLKKSDLTGAVSKVTAKDLQGPATTDAVAALQGKMAGVVITPNSGEPGAGMKIQVRGTGSWKNSDPLYVVDGFQIADLSSVDPSNIANIEVLKDASATAIYGSRGANGVVLVTTKKGLVGPAVVEATAYAGAQWASNTMDMCNASEYATLYKEAYTNDGLTVDNPNLDYAIANNMQGTDWQKEIMQVAPIKNFSVSVRGGSETNKYSVGATYFDQEGIVKNSGMKKLYAYVNNSYQLGKKVNLDANLSYSTYKKNDADGSAWSGGLPVALQKDPLTAAWDPYTNYWGVQKVLGNTLGNPARAVDEQKEKLKGDNRFIASVTLNISDIAIKGLSFRTMAATQMAFAQTNNYSPYYYLANDDVRPVSSLYKKSSKNVDVSWNGYFNYVKEINDHSINATVGSEIQSFRNEEISGSRNKIPNNQDLRYFNQSKEPVIFTLSDAAGEDRLASFFARANYAFQSKYLFTATFRADGNSKFAPENQWGYFPSFSAGWNVKEEGFMDSVELIDRLKLRAGWGEVGNANAANSWEYISLMKNEYDTSFGGNQVSGAKSKQISNPDLKWEVSTQLNGGVDVTLLNQKLEVSLDYFIRDTKDMQISKPIPTYVGNGRPLVNAASMRNKGIEYNIQWNDNIGDLNYNIGFNGSFIKNEIIDMAGATAMDGGSVGNGPGNTTRTENGYEVAYFYGLKTDGIFNDAAELAAHSVNGVAIQPAAAPGDVKFVDLNGDGKIDGSDRAYLGSAQPDFTFGLNGSADYKGIDLRLALTGSFGNEIVNGVDKQLMNSNAWSNWKTDKLDRWTVDNPSSNVPRVTSKDKNENTRFSDRYVEDGSYISLRNIQLGYSLPKSVVSKLKLSKFRIYISGDNLLRWTNYTGFTPEIGNANGILASGVDYATYPTPIIITGGINVNF